MGCMTTLILASEYPDLYAVCMFADGQWDTKLLSNLEGQTFVYFAAEDDAGQMSPSEEGDLSSPESATDASSDISEDKPAMEMTGEKPEGMMGGNGGGAGGGAT